jgi:glucose-6-phosphate 1-dehydrogenase
MDRPELEAVTIVIFGASGDLAHRKIVPALHSLYATAVLHPDSRILGVSRRPQSDAEFREGLRESCARHSRCWKDGKGWEAFASMASYLQGDVDDPSCYGLLARRLEEGLPRNLLFYLAISPDQFSRVARGLEGAGLGSVGREAAKEGSWRRLLVEKPFGTDGKSAHELNRVLSSVFDEGDIFRIDHYLGKEVVQNLLYFRFANSVFEPLWNRRYIEKVEIDVLETQGIGTRGGYYDRAGAARDMLQNHLIQLLCLAAMEPPSSLDPEAIRDEKVKVLRSIPRYTTEAYHERSARGQYRGGRGAGGESLPDYLGEAKVAPASLTETFASLRLEVDNWRFAGVPFILRTGKALDRGASEIRVHFRRPPATLFAGVCSENLPTNEIVIRIQPDEGIWLNFNAKEPGSAEIERKELRFSYAKGGGESLPEAYERLLADAFAGDSTLFIRADETEEAWRVVDGLELAWLSPGAPRLIGYPAGSSPDDPLFGKAGT